MQSTVDIDIPLDDEVLVNEDDEVKLDEGDDKKPDAKKDEWNWKTSGEGKDDVDLDKIVDKHTVKTTSKEQDTKQKDDI